MKGRLRIAVLTLACLVTGPSAFAQNGSSPALALPPPATGMTVEGLYAILTERDRQYLQRFDEEDKALTSAVLSLKEGQAIALIAQEKNTAAAFAAAKEAVLKAEAASEKRFESVNEFRASLKDQQTQFVNKSEVEVRIKSLNDKLDDLSARLIAMTARSEGAGQLWGLIAGGLGLIFGIIGIVMMILTAVSRREAQRRDDRRIESVAR